MNTYTTTTTSKPFYSGIQIVWFVIDILEILLLARFLLKFFGANPAAPFTNFIYQVTYAIAYPFMSVFNSTALQRVGEFEWNSLLAMAVFYIIGLVVDRLFLEEETLYTTRESVVKMHRS